MRIGELSDRTGTPRRLLRYYEEQQLIVADRAANGYRDYDEDLVDQVLQIRGLLESGLPTRIIKEILPRLEEPRAIHLSGAAPEIIATLEREVDQMTARIQGLIRNRDAVCDYLATVSVPPHHPGLRTPGVRSGQAPARTPQAPLAVAAPVPSAARTVR
jgi:DNA-binding transcriptional MerR regulator